MNSLVRGAAKDAAYSLGGLGTGAAAGLGLSQLVHPEAPEGYVVGGAGLGFILAKILQAKNLKKRALKQRKDLRKKTELTDQDRRNLEVLEDMYKDASVSSDSIAAAAFLQGYMDKEANAFDHKQNFANWSKPGAKLPEGVTYDKAKNQFRHANGGITSQYGYVGRATPAQAKAAQARKNTPEAREAARQEKWRTNARKRLNGISVSDAQADKLIAQARNHNLAKDDITGRNAHYDKVFNDFRNSDYSQAQTKAYQNLAKSNMQRTKNKRKELQSLQAYKDNGGRAANTSLADATRPGSDPKQYERMKAYQQQVANAKAYDPIRTSPSRNNWTDTGMVAFDNKHPENRMYNQGAAPKTNIKDLSSSTSKANAPVPSEAPTVAASSVPTHVADNRPQPRLLTEPERQQNFYRELSEFPELQDQYLAQTMQNYQSHGAAAPKWTQGQAEGAPALHQLINRK